MPTRPRLRSGNASMIKTTGSFLGTVIVRSHRSHVFWALFPYSFSGFPDLLRGAQPGTAKGRVGFSRGVSANIPHTFDKINTVLFLWLINCPKDPRSSDCFCCAPETVSSGS